jgi:SAM-dependent methyltransferase
MPALRIYRDDNGDAGPDPAEAPALAAAELLRTPSVRPRHRELEPYSRAWFEELELKRYAPPGGWLRRCLEFTRHSGESVLLVGPGVGSDALQYLRHGADVTACCGPLDRPLVVTRNFGVRGLACKVVGAPTPHLPFPTNRFDLGYLNLLAPPPDPSATVAELYRVLKPGGKLFVLAPAYFDGTFWARTLPWRRWFYSRQPGEPERYSARSLKRLVDPFSDSHVVKRHLRRGDLPYLFRPLPGVVLEPLFGRVLVLRGFKPVSSALAVDPAA